METQSTVTKHTPGKKPYRAPTLTNYGSAAKLTQGQGSLTSDGGSGGKAKK